MTTPAISIRICVPANTRCFDSGVKIEPGHCYRFIVEGTWIDYHDSPVGPRGNPHPGGIREWMEWAKQLPGAPWKALLVRTQGNDGKSNWRLLGQGEGTWSDLPLGKLQLCANDVPGFYFNNSGEMDVTVIDVS